MSLHRTEISANKVFSYFNFRPKGQAKCFAGDVGSVGIAFILLFMIGMLICVLATLPGCFCWLFMAWTDAALLYIELCCTRTLARHIASTCSS